MQKLLNPNEVPADGFRYRQPETGTWIRAADYGNLFINVRDHRRANNLPLGTFWESEVEDQLCQMLPAGFCKQVQPGEARNVFTRVSWEDVHTGTHTIGNWIAQGLPKVAQEVADFRADTCSRCYYNVDHASGCHACGQLRKLATAFIGTKRTSSDPFLKVCAVCKCSLQAKVWVPIATIAKGTSEEQYGRYPSFCWIPKELDVYRLNQK